MTEQPQPPELRPPSLLGPFRKARASGDNAPASLSEIAYDRFFEALFGRKLPPGAFVSQSELVALLDVPVGPLRDALRVLQTEGIVSIRARSGIEIAKPDMAMARHTYQIRGILEQAAVRAYAETAPMSAILAQEERHLETLAKLGRGEPTEEDIRTLEELDPGLHIEMVRSLRNPLVEDTYRRIQSLLNLILMERNLSGPLMTRTLKEHLKVLEACKARDPDAAEAALKEHFALGLERAMNFL